MSKVQITSTKLRLQWLAVGLVMMLLIWAVYISSHPTFSVGKLISQNVELEIIAQKLRATAGAIIDFGVEIENMSVPVEQYRPKAESFPVLGPLPIHGAKPLYGIQHQGGDAIFALATNYPKHYYQRFVGSLRKAGYKDDVVLAVSPPNKLQQGVAQYIKEANIVAYGFEVNCIGTDNCKLKDEFLGYPDPRPHRTFANIRYALYEYWLRNYPPTSYILILDFRDTFFQSSPFASFGPPAKRDPTKYDLHLFAENYKVRKEERGKG